VPPAQVGVCCCCGESKDNYKARLLTAPDQARQNDVASWGASVQTEKGNAHLPEVSAVAPMPNLENLRKQAKQYLRWHRDRYYPVAAAIRMSLPQFRQLSDEQILDASFKLADAQELVARQKGFSGWQALKSGADAMSETRHVPQRPILTSIAAQLFVADIKISCEYFTTKLGFEVDFIYGDPPFYGQVTRDNARVALRQIDEPVFRDIRDREHLLSAAITVATTDEIKQLFLAYQSEGVNFHQTLKKEPWGARNFIVRDPDGNLILFAGPAD
jgi:catechol 2,3-dioxygenase-like lactoylglutathione lyase family enzyme